MTMTPIALRRPARSRSVISLVPMIDVMMILLVFFMVTSTYLDLDMIPAVQSDANSDAPVTNDDTAATLMIRLGADGVPRLRGQTVDGGLLKQTISDTLRAQPLTQVVVLPSAAATTQALISVMDIAADAGARRLRVIRLEARP